MVECQFIEAKTVLFPYLISHNWAFFKEQLVINILHCETSEILKPKLTLCLEAYFLLWQAGSPKTVKLNIQKSTECLFMTF